MILLAKTSSLIAVVDDLVPVGPDGAGAGGVVIVGSRVAPEPGAVCANAPMVSRKPRTDTMVTEATNFFMAYLLAGVPLNTTNHLNSLHTIA